eukprot:m51a1_g10169 inosine diphosphate phosphatase, putative (192) ;mRNA; r:103511-104325
MDSERCVAAHCALYCRGWEQSVQAQIESWPVVLMTLRFDGSFGFPGGFLERSEDPRQGLAREIYEEMGFAADPERLQPLHAATLDLRLADSTPATSLFYTCEITREQLREIEGGAALRARDWASEVLGVVRLPPVGHWWDREPGRGRHDGLALRTFVRGPLVPAARSELRDAAACCAWLAPDVRRFVFDSP